MIEVAIMLEGQNGLNWEHWKRIAHAVEELGYAGLFRSDHFTNARPPDKDSLEMWVSLTWLADNTERIQFGPMVSPLSFRHPVFAARMGKDVDELSNGRFILGLGAGWQEREHEKFGFDLLEIGPRFDRFEEGVELVHRLLREDEPVNFEGNFYNLKEAALYPRPSRTGRPPILIGGRGWNRTLPLTARYADEWNCGFRPPQVFDRLNRRLNELMEQEGRDPSEIRRSLANITVFGRDEQEVASKIEQRGYSEEGIAEFGVIHGTASQIRDQIGEYEAVGVELILLQWLELEDVDGLEQLAKVLL